MTIQVGKQRSGSVFLGYFEDDGEVQSPDVFRKKSIAVKRDHFPVVYQGLAKVNGEEEMIGPVQAKLMFVGNITTGGFKIQEV